VAQEAATFALQWLVQRSAIGSKNATAAVTSAVATAASQTETVLVNALLNMSAYGYTVQQGACTGVRLLVAAAVTCATAAAEGVLLPFQWVWRCCKVCMLTLCSIVFSCPVKPSRCVAEHVHGLQS
jgi:hypothetical protein